MATKFRTKDAVPETRQGSRYQNVTGKLRVLSEEKKWLYNVEVWLLNDVTNRNNWRYENLEKHASLFEETPILVAYPREGKVGDGHNFRDKTDWETGEEYASFTDAAAERIVGWFEPGSIHTERKDGTNWIVGKGKIWAYYSHELTNMLDRQGDVGMDVSIETMVNEDQIEMDGETEVYKDYAVLGTTILGQGVTPAVAGARIRALSDIGGELKKLQLRVASYVKETGNPKDAQDAKTQKGVKRAMNSTKLYSKMQALFPDYHVLDVSEDEKTVMLSANKDGDVCGYVFSDDLKDTVVDARFQNAHAVVNMTLASGYAANVPLEDCYGPMQRKLADANAELAKEKKLREDAENALEVMRKKETARRKNAAKAALRKALAEINETMSEDEKIDEKVCEDIDKDIDEGEYEEAENAEGEWCGDEKACAALKAVCMDKVIEHGKRENARNRTVFAWNRDNTPAPTGGLDDDTEALLADMHVSAR